MSDEIIKDVRKLREELVEELGGVEGLFQFLQSKEAEDPSRYARPQRERTSRPDDAASGTAAR